MKTLLSILLTVGFIFNANAQKVISLYEGKAKGSENWTWEEAVSEKNIFNTKVVYNVSSPTITAYLPEKPNGTSVIIAPGGAFHTLSIDNEGTDVAKWLNAKGVTAFVLKYRVVHSLTDDPVKELMPKMANFKALDEENATVVPLATQDGLTAVKYVRDHAKELNLDPEKIGFMGFQPEEHSRCQSFIVLMIVIVQISLRLFTLMKMPSLERICPKKKRLFS
jgi:hypothetical protein